MHSEQTLVVMEVLEDDALRFRRLTMVFWM